MGSDLIKDKRIKQARSRSWDRLRIRLKEMTCMFFMHIFLVDEMNNSLSTERSAEIKINKPTNWPVVHSSKFTDMIHQVKNIVGLVRNPTHASDFSSTDRLTEIKVSLHLSKVKMSLKEENTWNQFTATAEEKKKNLCKIVISTWKSKCIFVSSYWVCWHRDSDSDLLIPLDESFR